MRHLPVYILIDTSGSMKGEPIKSVKVGLADMIATLRQDPYALETVCISIITFDREVKQVMPLTELEKLQLPDISISDSEISNLGLALKILYKRIGVEVKKNTAEKKGDWRPHLFVFTNGILSDVKESDLNILRIKTLIFDNVVVFTGAKAKVESLKKLTNQVFCLDAMEATSFIKFFVF